MKVGLVGLGYLGSAYAKVFPDAVMYDEPKGVIKYDAELDDNISKLAGATVEQVGGKFDKDHARSIINKCDIAIVAVPTDPLPNGSLDMSIVEEVVDWVETPLILIKSALMPGTVDRLVEKTGKKIAVSLEMIGMGKYYLDPSKYPDPLDPQKHQILIIGGELETAERCAEVLWDKMSPNIRIHLLTAKEVEMCKLIENAYGALKVTFINCMYDYITKSGGSFIRSHQAWSGDSRVDGVHLRTVSWKRGWKSHCYSKDIPALAKTASDVGADSMANLINTMVTINEEHLKLNDKD